MTNHFGAFVSFPALKTTSFLPQTHLTSSSQQIIPRTSTHRRRRCTPCAKFRRGAEPNPEVPESIFDAEKVKDIDFEDFDFSTLKGKVILLANVASEDDYTDSNYKVFSSLLDSYHSSGFEVLAFPSNWFGQKETATHEEIKTFVYSNYSDKIKLFLKSDIEWNQAFALGCKYYPGEIIWNFHGKFLFDRQGIPVARFDLLSTDDDIRSAVSRVMDGQAPTSDLPLEVSPPDPEPEQAAL